MTDKRPGTKPQMETFAFELTMDCRIGSIAFLSILAVLEDEGRRGVWFPTALVLSTYVLVVS